MRDPVWAARIPRGMQDPAWGVACEDPAWDALGCYAALGRIGMHWAAFGCIRQRRAGLRHGLHPASDPIDLAVAGGGRGIEGDGILRPRLPAS